MLGKLTQLEGDSLRTKEIEGDFLSWPIVGEPFVIYSEPLDPKKDMRMVVTSAVKEVNKKEQQITFVTRNSTYLLEWRND